MEARMKKILVTVFAMSLVPAVALAQGFGGHGGGQKGGHMMMAMFDKLDLSKEQKMKFRTMRLEMRRFMIKLHSEIDLKKLDLEEELMKTAPDKAKLNTIIGDLAALKAKHEKRRLEFKVALVGELTPEQKEKYFDMKMTKGRKGGHHKGGHGGGAK